MLTSTEIDAPLGYENNLHTHPPSGLFSVLDGEMPLSVGESAHHLTPDTVGFVPADVPHGFRVVGAEPLRLLAVFVPAGMADLFREVGTPVGSWDLPGCHGPTQGDLDRMMAATPKYDMQRLGPLLSGE